MREKLRVFEAFAGYGSQSIAIRNIGIPYEVVAISEIDKYAIQAYEAIHGDVNNLGDISKIKVEDIPDHDLFTYSFPCQDISVSGKQQGMVRGETRSGLLYECEKIIESKKPKYLLLENVKNLVGKKHIEGFNNWLAYLEGLGYTNYWKILDAKDFGIPQHRERVFVVSILGAHESFKFPKPVKLETKLKDILENNADDKYNLKDVKRFFIKNSFDMEFKGNGFRFKPHVKNNADVSFTITTRCGGRMDDNFIIDLDIDESKFEYSVKFIKDFLVNNDYHNRFLINLQNESILNKLPGSDDIKIIGTTQNPDAIGTNCRHWVHDIEGIIGTLSATDHKQPKQIMDAISGNIVIRKLTPKESFRLMGLSDNDIEKLLNANISNTQLYKLAGNSIVVDILEGIFKNMFIK